MQADVARVVAQRDALARGIGELSGFVVTPPAANFLWVKTPLPAEKVWSALVEEKILVRSFHAKGGRMTSQLRITVGTEAENARLLESLAKIARRA